MANTNWFNCTNQVLSLASLDLIPDETTFDADGDELDKYQRITKYAVKLVNQHLGLRCRRHFSKRFFQFTITPQTTNSNNMCLVKLDLGISGENISPHSFFNYSNPAQKYQGTAFNAGLNQRLGNWKFEEYLRAYPNPSLIPDAPPTKWILLPIDRANFLTGASDDDTQTWVQIYPNPDQPYQIIYQAKVNAQQLQESSDLILFPPEYEHAVWEFAWFLLEKDLGEGKEGTIAQMAQEAASQVELAAGMPMDVRKAPRFMKINSIRSLMHFYSSPISIDAQGNPTPWG